MIIFDESEKWVTHYSSNHQILLVGDGDFSFSLCLARSFGSAYNIVASSLDSHDAVIKKYKEAKSNLMKLHGLGANVVHGVDAKKMILRTDLRNRRFDRIIFNFPHAGFYGREDDTRLIEKHRSLVRGFFSNAKEMLRPDGEIHMNHKTTPPFSLWNLEGLASSNSLVLIGRVDFRIEDYPSYRQKRGDSKRCDEPFPLGEASTFMFQLSPRLYKEPGTALRSGLIFRNPNQVQVWNLTNPFDPFGIVAFENGIRARPGFFDDRVREPIPNLRGYSGADRHGMNTRTGYDFGRGFYELPLERGLSHPGMHVSRPEIDPRTFHLMAGNEERCFGFGSDSRMTVYRPEMNSSRDALIAPVLHGGSSYHVDSRASDFDRPWCRNAIPPAEDLNMSHRLGYVDCPDPRRLVTEYGNYGEPF